MGDWTPDTLTAVAQQPPPAEDRGQFSRGSSSAEMFEQQQSTGVAPVDSSSSAAGTVDATENLALNPAIVGGDSAAQGAASAAAASTDRGGTSGMRSADSSLRGAKVGSPRRLVAAWRTVSDDNAAVTVLGGLLVVSLGFGLQVLNGKIDQAKDRITSLEVKVDAKFERLETKFEKRFDEVDAEFEKRFDEVDAEFEKRFDEVDAEFDEVDTKFDEVDAKFDKLEDGIGKLHDAISDISLNLAVLVATLGKTEEVESALAVVEPAVAAAIAQQS